MKPRREFRTYQGVILSPNMEDVLIGLAEGKRPAHLNTSQFTIAAKALVRRGLVERCAKPTVAVIGGQPSYFAPTNEGFRIARLIEKERKHGNLKPRKHGRKDERNTDRECVDTRL